jgi:N-acetylmuramoyl-L-alanine amidase
MGSRVRRLRFHTLFLLLLIGPLWIGADVPAAWAGPSADGPRKARTTDKKRSRVKGTPASLLPATVTNFRVLTSEDKTRLVLDLDRETKVVERRATNPGRIVIALPNTALSASARVKSEDGTVPAPFIVTQSTAPSVAVTLPATGFRTYK